MLVNKLWKRMDKVEQEKRLVYPHSQQVSIVVCTVCRELEARLGSTPPPSPSDRNSPALLTSRIAQLSAEVDKLKRMLQQTEAQSGLKVLSN